MLVLLIGCASPVSVAVAPTDEGVSPLPVEQPRDSDTAPEETAGECRGYDWDGTVLEFSDPLQDDLQTVCLADVPLVEACAAPLLNAQTGGRGCLGLDAFLAALADGSVNPTGWYDGAIRWTCDGGEVYVQLTTNAADADQVDVVFGVDGQMLALGSDLRGTYSGSGCCDDTRVVRVWFGAPPDPLVCFDAVDLPVAR